jgi:Fe-S-cluster-containing dehydrogenase component
MKHTDDSFVPLASLTAGTAEKQTEATRRRFLEVMGASIAMTAMAGCTRQPTEFILPYVTPPEGAIPGRPSYYATASVVNGYAQGIVVESHLGRPTKVEGNPQHPASMGATAVHGQSCVLDLYDPDRAKQVTENDESRDWESFQLALTQALPALRTSGGAGLSILTETVTSPSVGAQLKAVTAAYPNAHWYQFDPAGPHTARDAARIAFGRIVNTYYRLDRADVVLSLDSDFLTTGAGSTRYAHDFASRRQVRGSHVDMNRLYVVESEMTPTGGKADHRLALRYADIEAFARQLSKAVASGGKSVETGPRAWWISALAQDLLAHRGACAIIPGDHQSPTVHVLAHAMNAALGNAGSTVIYTDPIEAAPGDQLTSLRELVAEMSAGHVQMLLILGGNPVYSAPADLSFHTALSKVPNSIHLSLHANETSALTRWIIPQKHFLEDWGDARSFDGTVTILQPLLQPLYNGRSSLEMLDAFLFPVPRPPYDIVRAYWTANSKAADFEGWWRSALQSGLVVGSALPPLTLAAPRAIPDSTTDGPPSHLDLLFRPDPYILDGRYANNAWLQELPKPLTKLTWDNAVHLSPKTAQRLGLENEHLVELTSRGQSVRGPVWISDGQADDTVIVHLGYGRRNAGKVGNNAGFNVYPLRSSDALWATGGAQVRAIGGKYRLATTQTDYRMEGRELAICEPVATYVQDPDFVKKRLEIPERTETLYPPWKYPGYSWGMSIDLTACVDCMACVIACQAENNIPVVGKEEQLVNREMHWLRVDVYNHGSAEAPEMRYQPVPCMHCEDAPCEYVCPVAATTHSSDGLNEMTYNRCIGTRYCSNNCPYKVRRFNFLLYNDWITDQLKMQRNPDVTVRSRGVMEKCTYCVQRIREAEIRSIDENRSIRDGEILTACQQVCPTRAIVFGDLNQPANRVARLKAEKLDYPLLAELNTRPHTTYLAELRNPNPALKERTD